MDLRTVETCSYCIYILDIADSSCVLNMCVIILRVKFDSVLEAVETVVGSGVSHTLLQKTDLSLCKRFKTKFDLKFCR